MAERRQKIPAALAIPQKSSSPFDLIFRHIPTITIPIYWPFARRKTTKPQQATQAKTTNPAPNQPEPRKPTDMKRLAPLLILLVVLLGVLYQLYHKAQPSHDQQPATKLSIQTPNPNANGSIGSSGAQTQMHSYTVKANESLWIIAQQETGSGYNWVAIAKASNLANPNDIHVGDVLTIPATTPTSAPNGTFIAKSQPDSYTVKAGDSLWNIAQRFYGDPYQWPTIAKANHLANPQIIHAGNVLAIPPRTASP